MNRKRQVQRLIDAAKARPSASMIAMSKDTEYRKAIGQACSNAILEDILAERAKGVAPDSGARAINHLQQFVDSAVPDPRGLRIEVKASAECEAFSSFLSNRCEQVELQRAELAQYAWSVSEKIVEADLDDAVTWATHRGEFSAATVAHVTNLASLNFARSSSRIAPPPRKSDFDPELWATFVRTSGGGTYFLRYAVAVATVLAFISVGRVIAGEGDEHDIPRLEHPLLGKMLTSYTANWTEHFEVSAVLIGDLHPDARVRYLAHEHVMRAALIATYEHGLEKVEAAAKELRVFERDAKMLRRRLSTAEDAITQAKVSARSLQESFNAVRATAAARAPAAQREKEFEAQLVEMREKDAQIRKLQDAVATSDESLARTRELLDALLEPAPGAANSPGYSSASTNPEDWRIVFVGGHERLHHKLRKQLRSATFLHPDQSQFSPEIFDQADAVIYSINYCSHSLAYRAANEMRKRNLRAGYSHFTNVDIVIDEVRAVLSRAA